MQDMIYLLGFVALVVFGVSFLFLRKNSPKETFDDNSEEKNKLSVEDGFRFGVGFAIGTFLVALFGVLAVAFLFGSLIPNFNI